MEDKEALEMVDVENIDPKLLATIEKKVADLKANNPKAKIVPLVVEGEPDFDEKEAYVGYFSRPSSSSSSLILTPGK